MRYTRSWAVVFSVATHFWRWNARSAKSSRSTDTRYLSLTDLLAHPERASKKSEPRLTKRTLSGRCHPLQRIGRNESASLIIAVVQVKDICGCSERHVRSQGECRAVHGCGLCLLGNLLDHPKEEVGERLFDPQSFQLGGDLTGTGSATYCSAVSLRQASRTFVLAQRSYANKATTASCMRISPGLGQGRRLTPSRVPSACEPRSPTRDRADDKKMIRDQCKNTLFLTQVQKNVIKVQKIVIEVGRAARFGRLRNDGADRPSQVGRACGIRDPVASAYLG